MFLTATELRVRYPDVGEEPTLRQGQLDNVQRLLDILLKRKHGALDQSLPGSGKTYTTCYLAKLLKARLLVIGPKTLSIKWFKVAAAFGLSIAYLSYGQMRSSDCPLVQKKDDEFVANKKLAELLGTEPILLVYEECFHLKNKSLQAKACVALSQAVRTLPNVHILLLSATVNDHRDKIAQTVALMGIISTLELYYYNRELRRCELRHGKDYGLKQMYDYCYRLAPLVAEQSSPYKTAITPSVAPKLFYDLYKNILNRYVSSEIKCQTEVKCTSYNYFTALNGEEHRNYLNSCNSLNDIVAKRETCGKGSADDLGQITKALVIMSQSKVPAAVKIVQSYLITQPTVKVVVSVRFLTVIDMLREQLHAWNPLVYVGKHSTKEREDIRLKFQTDDRCRLLIMNPQVGGEGIDLDDQVGDHPRIMIIFPDFDLNLHYQASCRIYRPQASRSHSVVLFLFAQYSTVPDLIRLEKRIIEVLQKKSTIIHEIRNSSKDQHLILPGHSQDWIEPASAS